MVKVILLILIPQIKSKLLMLNQVPILKEKTNSELMRAKKKFIVINQQAIMTTEIKYLKPDSEINLDPPNRVQHKKLKKGRHNIHNI